MRIAHFLSLAVFSVGMLASASTRAQSGASSPDTAITASLHDPAHEGLMTLMRRGANIQSLRVVERLPRGGYGAEVAFTYRGDTMRLPVKLARTGGTPECPGWRVTWAPDAEYVMALLNLTTAQGALITLDEGPAQTSWGDLTRLPALPIVITRRRVVSPYGPVDFSEIQDIDPSLPGASLAPPPTLSRHVARWGKEYLEGEPGAAHVDLIVEARVSWQDTNRVVFAVAAEGLYKLSLIARCPRGLCAVDAAAPVFDGLPALRGKKPLVIGLYPLKGQMGLRVNQGEALLREEDTCDPEMSFCVGNLAQYDARLSAMTEKMRAKSPNNPAFAVFAAPGEVTIGELAPWLVHLSPAIGVASTRIFLGYIQR